MEVVGLLELPLPKTEIAVILNFLKPQTKLKYLGLGKINISDTEIATQLLDILDSRDLKFFTLTGDVLQRRVLEKLQNAVELSLGFVKTRRLAAALNSDVFPKLESLIITGLEGRGCARTIVQAFPNLTTILIQKNETRVSDAFTGFRDADLQIIIRNLINLRNMYLYDCARISDFGVSGIEHSWRLKGFGALFLKRSLSELGILRDGLPLSSLKCKGRTTISYLHNIDFNSMYLIKYLHNVIYFVTDLTDLVLRTTSSFISDVGIHFGLNFKDLRGLNLDVGEEVL